MKGQTTDFGGTREDPVFYSQQCVVTAESAFADFIYLTRKRNPTWSIAWARCLGCLPIMVRKSGMSHFSEVTAERLKRQCCLNCWPSWLLWPRYVVTQSPSFGHRAHGDCFIKEAGVLTCFKTSSFAISWSSCNIYINGINKLLCYSNCFLDPPQAYTISRLLWPWPKHLLSAGLEWGCSVTLQEKKKKGWRWTGAVKEVWLHSPVGRTLTEERGG